MLSGLPREWVVCANNAVLVALIGEVPDNVFNKEVIPQWETRFSGRRLIKN